MKKRIVVSFCALVVFGLALVNIDQNFQNVGNLTYGLKEAQADVLCCKGEADPLPCREYYICYSSDRECSCTNSYSNHAKYSVW